MIIWYDYLVSNKHGLALCGAYANHETRKFSTTDLRICGKSIPEKYKIYRFFGRELEQGWRIEIETHNITFLIDFVCFYLAPC